MHRFATTQSSATETDHSARFMHARQKNKTMSINKPVVLLLAAFSIASAQAVPLLGAGLDGYSIVSTSYSTLGANAVVSGNLWSGDYATVGAGSSVSGNMVSVGAVNIGGGTIGGNLISGGAATIGAYAAILGYISTNGATTLGASAIVNGSVFSIGAVGTGDSSRIGGDLMSGGAATVGASTAIGGNLSSGAAVVLGANATVGGDVVGAEAVTRGAGATVGGSITENAGASVEPPPMAQIPADAKMQSQAIIDAQIALGNLGAGTDLGTTTISSNDTTLDAGVYSSAGFLTTTAGTTLTLDGHNRTNQSWIFNIAQYLTTGASTNIVLKNAGEGASVIWNIADYASLGAVSKFLGTIFSGNAITVGANSVLTGVDTGKGVSCGGLMSAKSNVTLGAEVQVGSKGCQGVASGLEIGSDGVAMRAADVPTRIPEPATYIMLLCGLALLSLIRSKVRRAPGCGTKLDGSLLTAQSQG